MNLYKNIALVTLILMSSFSQAQLKVDAEIRPRAEYRHGFKTLFPNHVDPALFVSQRTRLNLNYAKDNMIFFLSFQDVRVWGDVPQLNVADANGLGVHQAWAAIKLDPNFSLKIGRQEVIYDDSRIFGNVGWAQQARSHDLALFQFRKQRFKMDVGLAFNQSKERLTGTTLTTPRTYKALQYAWLHNDWDNFSGSFLFLNNGLQSPNGLKYSQTIGTHLKTVQQKLSLTANLYYQFGNDAANKDINAYLLGLTADYAFSKEFKLGLGLELLSGNDYNTAAGKNNAFTPFYGTNHKFNGFMDYFYVGNHMNSVGLLDIYTKAKFTLHPKSSLTGFLHNFSAAADINATANRQLGTEIDLVYAYTYTKNIGLKIGYSHLFAANSMEILKGNTDNNTNNWAWVMLTIKPTLFTTKN